MSCTSSSRSHSSTSVKAASGEDSGAVDQYTAALPYRGVMKVFDIPYAVWLEPSNRVNVVVGVPVVNCRAISIQLVW